MIRIIVLLACLGHIICGITDCMMAYSKNGRFDFSDTSENAKMQIVFSVMPIKQIEFAIIAGVIALFISSFGYVSMSLKIKEIDPLWGSVMLAASLFFMVLISAHHVLCGAVEWFYIRFGMTEEARLKVTEFFKRTAVVAIAYVGLLVYAVILFVFVITGKTELPRWGCIFNTLPLFLILLPTKIPAKGNIANAVMFLGLAFLI